MEDNHLVMVVFGVLLGIIGYFLRLLHQDFRKLSESVIQLVERQSLSEERGRSGYKLLEQRLKQLEERIEKVEN
jgi:hypothetical protein